MKDKITNSHSKASTEHDNALAEEYIKGQRLRVCLISLPSGDPNTGARKVFIPNFVQVLRPLCHQIYIIADDVLIGDEKVQVLAVKVRRMEGATLVRVVRYLITELRICARLAQVLRKIDIVIFFVSGPLILPAMLAKLFRKRVSFVATGMASRETKIRRATSIGGRIFSTAFSVMEGVFFRLADQIAVESPSVVRFHNLGRFANKVSINGALYIDTAHFSVKNGLASRENIVGYVGHLIASKGVANLAKAMPLIAEKDSSVRFLVIGDGVLRHYMEEETRKHGLEEKVEFTGRIPRDRLPEYYNQMRLFVFPSYTEGQPGVVKEAMACGTPVLATPVGGIPDLIRDGETGFIIKENSPEGIAKDVGRALQNPKLDEIAQNARKLIEREYTYDAMVRKCQVALSSLVNDRRD